MNGFPAFVLIAGAFAILLSLFAFAAGVILRPSRRSRAEASSNLTYVDSRTALRTMGVGEVTPVKSGRREPVIRVYEDREAPETPSI